MLTRSVHSTLVSLPSLALTVPLLGQGVCSLRGFVSCLSGRNKEVRVPFLDLLCFHMSLVKITFMSNRRLWGQRVLVPFSPPFETLPSESHILNAKLEAVVEHMERARPKCSVLRAPSLPVGAIRWWHLVSEERCFCGDKRKTKFMVEANYKPDFLSVESSQLRKLRDVGLTAPLAGVRSAAAAWDVFPGLQLHCLC